MTFTVSNPSSNSYAINTFLVIGGEGATAAFSACVDNSADGFSFTTTGTYAGDVLASGGAIAVGSSDSFTCTFAPIAQSGAVNADSYTMIFKTADVSSSALVTAGSVTTYVTDSDATWGGTIAYVITPTNNLLGNPQVIGTLQAGSSVFIQYQLTSAGTPRKGLGGIPVTFHIRGAPSTYNTTDTSTLTVSGVTGPSGKANATFVPDPNFSTDDPLATGAMIRATAGGDDLNLGGNYQSGSIIVTKSAAATTISAKVATGSLNQAVGTVAIGGSSVTTTLTDVYGNAAAVTAAAGLTVTLAVSNVVGSSAGWACSTTGLYPAPTVATSITVHIAQGFASQNAGTATCASGSMFYWYGLAYGDQSFVTATATGFSTASSKTVTTWGFNSANSAGDYAFIKPGTKNVMAGSSIGISMKFTVTQANVPVTFAIVKSASSAKYSGTLAGSNATTATTNSKGIANATLVVSTTANAFTAVGIQYPCGYPEKTCNANGGHSAQGGATTGVITTIAGPAKTLLFLVSYDNTCTATPCNFKSNALTTMESVNGTKLYFDIVAIDAYNNTAAISTNSNTQIAVTPTTGLSASTLFIAANQVATSGNGFGPVAWTLSTTVGAVATLTASATGLTSATVTITTVSGTPSITVQHPTPVNGYLYSKFAAVTFSGVANTSAGYATSGPAKVLITKIGYSLNGGVWHTYVVPTPASGATWSFAVTLPSGSNTIQFNATDSAGNVVVSPIMQVIVDTAAPTIGFSTTTGSSVSAGSPVSAWAYDLEGDLNVSTIVVKANGTALPAADVAVTGSNTAGHNSTFTIAITGLTVGHWSLSLTAKDYAGNSAAAVTITVHVTVAFANSIVVSGTPSKTTIGGFTGVSATYQNLWSSSQNLVVFAVWKNSAGQTVAVSTSGMTLASGASGTAFLPLASSLPTGSYTVNLFVWTTSNNSVSSTTTITVTF